MSTIIQNPILPGFNADPSALWTRQGIYVVTSTFNWFPGISLYHSEDLVNWRLTRNILDRVSQLDLRGNGESCGIWAPHLSFNQATGLYYLVYTDVKSLSGSFFDLNNYVVTASHPEGPWSERRYLNSSGFDPALFHDDNGRSWLTNLAWEFEKGFDHPGGIILEEMDPVYLTLKGAPEEIYRGNRKFGCLEGPQLLKRDNWYYLVAAEGGTGYGHAVLVSRSRSLTGPYEMNPSGPLLTSRSDPYPREDDFSTDFLKSRFYNPDVMLQKAGHGSLIEDSRGRNWLFHLCARPLMPEMRCVLNRETALQEVEWKEGWPVLKQGGCHPTESLLIKDAPPRTLDVTSQGRDNFDSEELAPYWYSLKSPQEESWCSLARIPGRLSLRGRNSPYSGHDTSLIARRVQHFNCTFEISLNFEPKTYRQMAGLIILTGSRTFYYLRKYYSRRLKSPALGILVSRNGEPDDLLDGAIPLSAQGEIILCCRITQPTLQFSFISQGGKKEKVGPLQDATILSDEYTNNGPGAFDGTFCGMAVQDLDRQSTWAEFSYFQYKELQE